RAGINERTGMVRVEYAGRLGEIEVDLARPAAEGARREPGQTVAGLLHDRDAMDDAVGECESGGVASRSDDECRPIALGQRREPPPRANGAGNGSTVLPDRAAIERMQIEQLVRKFRGRKHRALDAAPRADKKGLDSGSRAHERARDRDARVQMSAGAAAGEDDTRHRRSRTARTT